MEKKKRVRSANFTPGEVRLLIKLTLKEKHVLEDKKAGSEMWKLKTNTWAKITRLFNGSSGQAVRTTEALRLKYECIKKELRKKLRKNKTEALKSGGGVLDYLPIDGPEEELPEARSFSVMDHIPIDGPEEEVPEAHSFRELGCSWKEDSEDRNEKVATLLDLRRQVVREQISALREKEKREKEKHEVEMRILLYEEEIKRRKLENITCDVE